MPTLHLVSLTALNRNTAVLRQAVTDQRLVLLTQHGRVALAVVNVEVFEQLLKIFHGIMDEIRGSMSLDSDYR